MIAVRVAGYQDWRARARDLLQADTAPAELVWEDATDTQVSLEGIFSPAEPGAQSARIGVPKSFLPLAEAAACHRDPNRWTILYRTLWRLTHGEHELLEIDVDDDVSALRTMDKAVRRDIHKMHAFVRFRRTLTAAGEHYVAWHRPDHLIVERATPFFARRFGDMHWTILTPDRSATWDTEKLRFGPGVPAPQEPTEDILEELWRAYYASIFNPARLKIKAMKTEMPVRHWRTLPEAELIPQLISQASKRTGAMMQEQKRSAIDFVPADHSPNALREAAKGCQGCDLFRFATQTVFGVGKQPARLMMVGEQPGDSEDIQGLPFVGPAGKLLDRALEQAGIDRAEVYVTNAVKHFKFTQEGKRRIHQKPRGVEIAACKPWLEAELDAVKPELIVCLGATASQAVFGRAVKIGEERGHITSHHSGARVMITIHPSALLRMPDAEQKEKEFEHLVADLRSAKNHLKL